MKKYIIAIIFNLIMINMNAQNPKDISDEQLEFITKMNYEIGKSFFSQKDKQPLSTKVDETYELPWSNATEVNKEELEKILIAIEKSITWEQGEFFDDSYLDIITTYITDEKSEIEFDENFNIKMVKDDLKDESGQALNIKSDKSRAVSKSSGTSFSNGVTTITKVQGHQFDLEEKPNKITGSVNIKMEILSGYEKVMLTAKNVGEIVKFNEGTYKLLLLDGGNALLEVVEQNEVNGFEYVCTNENGKVYVEEFSGFNMAGTGNSKIEIFQPTYDFFSKNPEGSFKDFKKYFDENKSRFLSAESEGHTFIGITNAGQIDKLHLYAQKIGADRQVNITLD